MFNLDLAFWSLLIGLRALFALFDLVFLYQMVKNTEGNLRPNMDRFTREKEKTDVNSLSLHVLQVPKSEYEVLIVWIWTSSCFARFVDLAVV